MPDASEKRTAQRKVQRKVEIGGSVTRFFARYTSAPTKEKIISDANRLKKSLDPYAYKRIIAAANKLTPATAARPAPNASNFFATPGTPGAGTAAAAPGGGLDPLPFILGAIALVFLLRR